MSETLLESSGEPRPVKLKPRSRSGSPCGSPGMSPHSPLLFRQLLLNRGLGRQRRFTLAHTPRTWGADLSSSGDVACSLTARGRGQPSRTPCRVIALMQQLSPAPFPANCDWQKSTIESSKNDEQATPPGEDRAAGRLQAGETLVHGTCSRTEGMRPVRPGEGFPPSACRSMGEESRGVEERREEEED
ncbi:hypothetical protein EYF80_057005 [Liparis tanakae]|uniref:Uncharacterized protein n=1 Tax=Liparis tanakae TaxID=230148 RepID=A0A4Z2EVE2_9TELE|nr:hypothetical protein EYF80_057005 [Liparis tanakae]